MPGNFLCRFSELPKHGCREFEVSGRQVFAVCRDGDVFFYLNQCPHVGTPLNWKPDEFLDYEGRYIQCYSHGALFELGSGLCVAGPCSGESLVSVSHSIEGDNVYLVEIPPSP